MSHISATATQNKKNVRIELDDSVDLFVASTMFTPDGDRLNNAINL